MNLTANYISNGDESLSTYGGTMVAKTYSRCRRLSNT